MRPSRLSFAAAAFSVLAGLSCCCYNSGTAGYRSRRGRSTGREPKVRVRLSAVTASATVSCDADLWVTGAGPDRRAGAVRLGREGGAVTVTSNGRQIGRTGDTLVLQGTQDALLRVGERSYRGAMLAFVNSDDELALVNELGMEDYLKGVVPCEIGPVKPETFAAVKAQAVAARSFTLTRLGARKGLGHQLFDTYKRDQEYRGAGGEVELANRAVEETRGEVLEYGGEACEALYHSTCGGHTRDGSKPYLKGVRDTPGHRRGRKAYCAGSRHFDWTQGFGRAEFEEKLGRASGRGGRVKVKSCRLEKGASGRARHLVFGTDRGELRIAGTDFRFGLGLKSTLLEVKLGRDRVTVSGHGWGHGSGMCQEGAVEMSRRGSSHRDILLHYYSGVKLRRYW